MCIIAIKPQGKEMFLDTQLETMFTNNPDGAGYMFWHNGKVYIKKGFMTLDALKKSLNKYYLTDTNVILHFRIGTSGNFDELNCHPYPVYQKNATVCTTDLGMAHNGILHDFTPNRHSPINDTQVFIQTVLRELDKGFQNDEDKLFLINVMIGSNKFAFLDSNNKITLVGDFIEDDGYIYSNSSYLPRKPKKTVLKPKYQMADFWEDSDETGFWKDWDERHTS